MGLFKTIFMAGAAGITYYSYNKYVATTKSLNSIDVNIDNIHDVSINLQHIKAKIDLKISNPSVYNLGVSTFDLISITEIQFFNKKNGSFIGVAKTKLSKVVIPAKESIKLKNIQVAIPVQSILENTSFFLGNANENLKIVLIFKVLGKEYLLNSK